MTIASIDIGTNTILLLIADVDFNHKQIHVIFNDQKIPRIGEGLKPGFPILEDKEKVLLNILEAYSKTAIQYGCEKILVTATNVFRIASNRDHLVKKINELFNLKVNVISGGEEARLTFLGCAFENLPNNILLVIDIGGGSTEIAYGTNKKIFSSNSLPLGVVSLTEKYFLDDPPSKDEIAACKSAIKEELQRSIEINLKYDKIIAVAGTPTTLACIKKGLVVYNEDLIEGDVLTKRDLENFLNHLSLMKSVEIKNKFKSVVEGREDVLLTGMLILFEMMNYLNAKEVVVSTKGVRYGAVYNYLLNVV
jgi:exopolyphosphatase/guanosine-5'-triphosphate,3'-diphosphate pyrophosphatase